MTKELQKIEKESPVLIQKEESLSITSKEDMTEATSILSALNKYNDSIIAEEDKVVQPLKQALKAEQDRFKPLKTLYKTAIESLRTKMGDYQTKSIANRLAEEKKIADRIGEGKGKLKLETAVAKIESLETVENKTETEEGSVSFMEVKDFEVMEMEMLPMEYHTANEVKIRADMKRGIEVKGVRYFTKQVPRNIR